MEDKDFSEYVKDKSFDQILHEGRKESQERILSEVVAPLALIISKELLKVLTEPSEFLKQAPKELGSVSGQAEKGLGSKGE